ncbi:MAG TPA: TetR/AcrR family transcriptional regulator [Bryobacteraceae bacterium]|nr:TetR/AcrR family transcriptional regulator [Bryobacteraceae bacterium]
MKTRKSGGTIRPVAGRPEILDAARSIGIRMGWRAVTIRALAQQLGYTSPLLYEHFRDKREILTELAIEAQIALAREMLTDLPADPDGAVLVMVERYWYFMLKNQQLYRLMNGMDGALIDRDRVTSAAQHSFQPAIAAVRAWLMSVCGCRSGAGRLFEDLWSVLHGMAALFLDRSAGFDVQRAKDCVSRVLIGAKRQLRDNPRTSSSIRK